MSIFKSLALALALLATAVYADQVVLKDGHPDRYVVVKGDTLWDISERFLDSPWLWPEIWYVNPQIENPHLIYPGDIINLVYVDGKPQLRVQRGKGTYKLSPQARVERLDKAIPTIPIDAIQQFLTQPLVADQSTLENAAYVVSSADEHLIVGAGDRIYVRGSAEDDGDRYHVFRPGEPTWIRIPEKYWAMKPCIWVTAQRREIRRPVNPETDAYDPRNQYRRPRHADDPGRCLRLFHAALSGRRRLPAPLSR